MTEETLEDLKKAIMNYDIESATSSAKKLIEEKVDPVKAIDAMTSTIRQVGDRFGKGELWIPDLVGASDAMSGAMPIMVEELKKKGMKRESLGVVVIGTVSGDIHNIGKSLVATLLTADGFDVQDLGVNITAGEFVKAVKEYNADILAMSAIMSMTAPEQKKTISALIKEGIRNKVKVMVGGAAITQQFAESIDADGYDSTAPGAVELARNLVGK